MDKELVNIVVHKSFVELSANERKELIEWCSNEEEFDQLKNVFIEVELLKKQQLEDVKPKTKKSLDALFLEKHGKNSFIWNSSVLTVLYPTEKPIYKRPFIQIAAVCTLIFAVYPFISTNSELKEAKSIAKLEKVSLLDLKKVDSSSISMKNNEKVSENEEERVDQNNLQLKKEILINESDIQLDSNSISNEILVVSAENESLSFTFNSVAKSDANVLSFSSPAPVSAGLNNNNERIGAVSNFSNKVDKLDKSVVQLDGFYEATDNDGIGYSIPVSSNSSVLDLLTATF